MTGKHSPEPTEVMHADDPVLVNHVPTVFNRKNVNRLTVFGIVATLLLLLYTDYSIIKERNDRRTQNNTSIQQLACTFTTFFPDSAAPIIPDLRNKYNCPKYVPGPTRPTPTRTTTATATRTVTAVPGVTGSTAPSYQGLEPPLTAPTQQSTQPGQPQSTASVNTHPTQSSPASTHSSAHSTVAVPSTPRTTSQSTKPAPVQSSTAPAPVRTSSSGILAPVVTPITKLLCNLGICLATS